MSFILSEFKTNFLECLYKSFHSKTFFWGYLWSRILHMYSVGKGEKKKAGILCRRGKNGFSPDSNWTNWILPVSRFAKSKSRKPRNRCRLIPLVAQLVLFRLPLLTCSSWVFSDHPYCSFLHRVSVLLLSVPNLIVIVCKKGQKNSGEY